jgi:DMSO reductase anchor subunit
MDFELVPLVVFTVCSGLSAGTFLMTLVGRLLLRGKGAETDTLAAYSGTALSAVCLLVLGIGLLATLLHLGQPMRFINGLSNPASMIAQESYWALAFLALLAVSALFALVKKNIPLAAHILGALAGTGLMIVTGLAYARAIGIPAWNSAITVSLFFISDIVAGVALCLVAFKEEKVVLVLVGALLGLLALDTVALASFWLHIASSPAANQDILLFASVVIGIVAPAVLGALALLKKIRLQSASIAVLVLVVAGIVAERAVFFGSGIHL